MGERHTLKLIGSNRAKAYKGIEAAIAKAKTGEPWTLELRERTRTDEQNDAVHGLIQQILWQRPTLNGLRMDKVSYKATFMQALGHEVKMLPTLDGSSFFPLGLSTSKLTVSEFANLIEYILGWCAEQDIEIKHFDDKPLSPPRDGAQGKPASGGGRMKINSSSVAQRDGRDAKSRGEAS